MNIQEWMKKEGKKIIVTDNLQNGNRLRRIYNMSEGQATVDVTSYNMKMLAEELVQGYVAFQDKEMPQIIQKQTAIWAMKMLLKDNPDKYSFIPKEALNDATATVVWNTLNQLRMGNKVPEYEQSKDKKLVQIRNLIDAYEEKLREKQQLDDVMVLQKAVEIVEKEGNNVPLYLPWKTPLLIGVLEKTRFTDLENKLLDSLCGIFKIEKEELEYIYKESSEVTYRCMAAYGIYNEVEAVLQQIQEKQLKYSDVNVLYVAPEYENALRGAFEVYGVPILFSNSSHGAVTHCVQFILSCLQWAKKNYSYEALLQVISNPRMTFPVEKKKEDSLQEDNEAVSDEEEDVSKVEKKEKKASPLTSYNRILREGICWGKERYIDYLNRVKENTESDSYQNNQDFLRFLERLLEAFQEDKNIGERYEALILLARDYTGKTSVEWRVLKDVLVQQILIFKSFEEEIEFETQLDMLYDYFDKLTYSQGERGDAVSAIYLRSRQVLERPYNFVLGLTANQLQCNSVESPVLSDEELKKYLGVTGEDDNRGIRLSNRTNEEYKESLSDTFGSLKKGEITLSYSSYDTVGLRENAPSVFYLSYKEKCEEITPAAYPSPQATKHPIENTPDAQEENAQGTSAENTPDIQEENASDTQEENTPDTSTEKTDKEKQDYEMSASALQTLIKCPLEYYYQYELHLPNQEFETYEVHRWLNPAQTGTVFHRAMQLYCDDVFGTKVAAEVSFQADKLEECLEAAVKEMESKKPYPSEEVYKREKNELQKVLNRYIENLHKSFKEDKQNSKEWHVLGSELCFGLTKTAANSDKTLFPVVYESAGDVQGDNKGNSQSSGNQDKNNNLKLQWRGSIDRLDGYVDDKQCLWLRVVDYKTGKKDNLDEKIKGVQYKINDIPKEAFENRQLQHYIYAIAAAEYVRQSKDDLKELFDKGEIKSVDFEKVCYSFPMNEGKASDTDVTERVKEAIKADKNDEFKKTLKFPEKVTEVLKKTVGVWQNELEEDDASQSEGNTDGVKSSSVEDYISTYLNDIFEKEKEVADALKTSKGYTSICEYCNYKKICRRKI